MSKKTRDYLLVIFVILFIFLTIFISLSASGYKFNLNWPLRFNKLLQKTGMLALDTAPRGAIVYLDDKPQKDSTWRPWKKNYITTPVKIKNVLPGEYNLRLEREGYWPFEKKIRINSGQTTFAENINLFRDDLPLLVTKSNLNELSLSSNKKYLYLISDKKIINLKNGDEKSLPLSSVDSGQWLRGSEKLLVLGTIFDPEKNNDIDYQKTIGDEADLWYLEEFTGRLYYRYKNSLNRLESNGKTNLTVIKEEDLLTYEPRGDHLFFVSKNQNKVFLKDYSLKNDSLEYQLELPSVGDYQFNYDNRKNLSLYDTKNKTLYLIDSGSPQNSEKIIKNVTSWQWLNDEQLLYSNNWEIYLFNLKQNQSILITRVSEEIETILWHSGNDYLIFSTATSLNAADLKNGTITTILKTEKITSPLLDEKEGALYFYAQIGQQEGIYKLLLQ